jgi:glycosyltransferase involved in cell wall biosynthesis
MSAAARQTPARVSVIVSTYENPSALALVLDALGRQTFPDFELLVADDGSGDPTRAVVESFAGRARQVVRHVWQPDQGVRRNTILNRAVLAAAGDYLVFLDGDCIAPPGWLAAHLAAAAPGWFVSGSKLLLSERLTQALFRGEVRAETLHRWSPWWREIGKSRRLAMSRLPLVRTLLDFNRRPRCGWVGEDSSTWAEHIHRVGGFDQRFTLVWDDADFCERLKSAGIRGRSIRYRAPVLHLEHGRGYRTDADVRRNLDLFLAHRAAGAVATEHGLALHPAGPTDGPQPEPSSRTTAR